MKTGDVIISGGGKMYVAFMNGRDGLVNEVFYKNEIKTGKQKELILSIEPDTQRRIFRFNGEVGENNNTGLNIYDLIKEALDAQEKEVS